MLYVISDVHGNIEGLTKALQKKGIIDKKGQRQLARKHKVISIGDLANCVHDSVEGDMKCLNMVGPVIDKMIIGNHEMGYIDPHNDFAGFHHDIGVDNKIEELQNNSLIIPAYLHNKSMLISHAGISKRILMYDMTGEEVMQRIAYHWEADDWGYSWFISVGRARGGLSACGGILWCDWNSEFVPASFPQVVGHTPSLMGVRMNGNTVCIDVGAKEKNTKPFILEVK